MIKLLPHQVENANALVEKLGRLPCVADRSTTGVGKTFMALWAAEQLNRPTFVVTTLSVVHIWKDLGADHCYNYERLIADQKVTVKVGDKTTRPTRNLKRHPDPKHYGGWRVANREWEWRLPKETLIIFDEAHMLGGQTSKVSKLLIAAKEQGYKILLLSATLIDSPLKLRAIGFALGLFKSYRASKFQAWLELNGCYRGDYNQMVWDGRDEDLDAVFDQMKPMMTGIIDIKDTDVPPTRLISVSVPCPIGDDHYTKALQELEENAEQEGVAALRARQESEWAKRNWFVARAKELEQEGFSVAIFCNFMETVRWLAKQLKCPYIAGETKSTRAEDIAAFQANEIHFLVLQAQAGGQSIGLHDLHGRPRATLISPGHNAIELKQVLGRVPRSGSRQASVPQYLVFARGSAAEQRVAQNLRKKGDVLNSINDSDLALVPKLVREEKLKKDLATDNQSVDHRPMPTATTDKDTHALVSPSNLKNLDACPHYKGKPQEALEDMHPTTVKGLKGHLIVELYYDPDKELGETDQKLYDLIDQEDVDAAQKCIEYSERVFESDHYDDTVILTEPTLRTPSRNTYGRCDLVFISKPRADLFDWKFGFNYQGDAKSNLQGKAYALGLMCEYPGVDEVTVHFYYPNLDDVDGQPTHTTFTFTREEHKPEIVEKLVDINRRYDLAQEGKTPRCPGDVCEHCVNRLNGECPEWNQAPALVEDSQLAALEKPKSWSITHLREDPDDMGRALLILSHLNDMYEFLKKEARIMVEEEDQDILGHDWIESSSGISITDINGVYEHMQTIDPNFTAEDLLAFCKISKPAAFISSIAKTLKEFGEHKTLKAADKWLREELSGEGLLNEGTSYGYLKKSKN